MVRQARAAGTRPHILGGAAAHFDRCGYEGAGLTGIVESIGVTKEALCFHFSSEEGLAHALIGEQHRRPIAAVEASAALERPALEQLVMLAYEMARQMSEDPIVRAGIRLTLEFGATDGPGAGSGVDRRLPCPDRTGHRAG